MNPKQQLRNTFLTVLKYTLNPLTRRVAHSSFGPFAIVRHVGRRSGKSYETPIIARPVEDGFVIELSYGYDVDWHKNVLAAGGCTMIWHRKEYVIDKIEPLDTKTGMAAYPPMLRLILRVLGRKDFEKMKIQPIEP
jgi:deazaflavin-dependent oxidoreductase (nitroreductase family)